MKNLKNLKNLINFFFELGQLRKIYHQGWSLIGVKNYETVAEHNLRAAQIGYFLAKLEKYDNPEKVVIMLLFHDLEECRIGDFHKVANRYVNFNKEKVISEQLANLGDLSDEILNYWKQVEERTTVAGIIAKDADLLEQALTAKELVEIGYKYAQDWINNVGKRIKTKSAKKIWEELQKTDSNSWWQGLKKVPA